MRNAYSKLNQKIEDLPLILAGPILRRTEPGAVTIWLALKESRRITLKVYATERGHELLAPVLEGTRASVQLGQNLHIVAVTATPLLQDNAALQPNRIYAYDLDFGQENLQQALSGEFLPVNLSYFRHGLPSFALPPDDLNDLQIVHGSCRKIHGGGTDALAIVDNLIASFADLPLSRPHQLFLTGDQIYGDDVADPLLWAASHLGDALLGWQEELPLGNKNQRPTELKPGQRSDIARDYGGFTAMLQDKPEKAKSHLFSFGEYLSVYLLAWSSVLWFDFPTGKSIYKERKKAQQWDREVQTLNNFARDVGQVRRALANLPTYMICDDHDISDDWYLNREWCNRVLGKPLGRQVLQNGLLAYALFQAWGNTPKQFSTQQPGEKLLQAVETWSTSAGTDASAWQAIGQYLGIPPINAHTGLPKLRRDGKVLVLDRNYEDDIQPLEWHYTVRSSRHEVIVLDTRTWRGYPDEEAIAPPMLLSPSAFSQQLEKPLEQTDSQIEATFVVLPTNLVSLSLIDIIQQWSLDRGKVFSHDVGDAWNLHPGAFAQLLDTLNQKRDRAIILSGDIHYGAAVRLDYWLRKDAMPLQGTVIAQLTSSAIKNAEWTTYVVHTKIKSLLPEKTESWVGWYKPPQLSEIVIANGRVKVQKLELDREETMWRQVRSRRGNFNLSWQVAIKDFQSLPDRQYQIEWIKREKARNVPGSQRPVFASSTAQSSFWRKLIIRFLSWLWCNRWLQEGTEVVGHNNISVVSLVWSAADDEKAAIQEVYWHPPWHPTRTVKSRYFVRLGANLPPSIPQISDKSGERVKGKKR